MNERKKPHEWLGLQFDVEKRGAKAWLLRYRGFLAARGETRKEAISNLEAKSEKDVLAAVKRANERLLNDSLWPQRAKEFHRIFGCSPPKCPIAYMIGNKRVLDVLKLDQLLHTPYGTSTKEFIRKKFGDEGDRAVRLVEEMM